MSKPEKRAANPLNWCGQFLDRFGVRYFDNALYRTEFEHLLSAAPNCKTRTPYKNSDSRLTFSRSGIARTAIKRVTWTVISMISEQIRILTVDDHPVFREGLGTIISAQSDMCSVGHASDFLEAISEFRLNRPDVTLMDQRLPGLSGIDTMIAIRREFPNAKIIMLSSYDGDIEIRKALAAGALAYVLKRSPKQELLEIIRRVHCGRRCIPSEVASRLAEYIGFEQLTERELEVLQLIRNGLRNKQIAGELAISETTVSFHIKNLVDKLQANDRTHAVTVALRRGLLEM